MKNDAFYHYCFLWNRYARFWWRVKLLQLEYAHAPVAPHDWNWRWGP